MNCLSDFVRPEEYDIRKNLTKSSSSFKKHFVARAAYFSLAPLSVVTSTVEGLVGLSLGAAAIAKVGKDVKLNTKALKQLEKLQELPSKPFYYVLKAINPNAKILRQGNSSDLDDDFNHNGDHYCNIFSDWENEGRLKSFTRAIHSQLTELGHACFTSQNKFKRIIASRLTFSLVALASIITRVFELAVGSGCVPLSLATLGKFRNLNTLAYRGLQITGLVRDLVFCTMKMINPGAKALNKE